MFKLETKIDPTSPEFLRNQEAYLKILSKFRETLAAVRSGSSEQAVKRHKERGKLLARERIDLLVDKNTPFIELSALAAFGLYNDEFPSAGIVTGIGVIHGKEVMIIANDAT
ncbi:MAG TPA: carboxyl transferase domain-containing protein, partial [Bacteroidales bacterium]|nr:carboxyl transferase domain-containing protein [Bacteroidales bacterium]